VPSAVSPNCPGASPQAPRRSRRSRSGAALAGYDLPGPKTVARFGVLGAEKAARFEVTEGNVLCRHEHLA
jgi:hypothetical protein